MFEGPTAEPMVYNSNMTDFSFNAAGQGSVPVVKQSFFMDMVHWLDGTVEMDGEGSVELVDTFFSLRTTFEAKVTLDALSLKAASFTFNNGRAVGSVGLAAKGAHHCSILLDHTHFYFFLCM